MSHFSVQNIGARISDRLERFPTGWSHLVDEKSLQVEDLEHILVDQIGSIRSEYALGRAGDVHSHQGGAGR